MSTVEAHYYGRKQNDSAIEASHVSDKLHKSVEFPLLSSLDIWKFKFKFSLGPSLIEITTVAFFLDC